jgi:outer membrane protein assembly factor BamB
MHTGTSADSVMPPLGLLWKHTAGNIVTTSPTVSNGVVYSGSDDNNVYALDVATGALKWKYTTGNGVYSSPAVSNGVVYVGSWDDNVYALDAVTGTLKWKYTTGNRVYSSPAVSNGVVYVGSYDDNVYALDAVTGTLKWKYTTGNGVYSSPAVSNGVVYVGSYDDNVYALDAVTGTLKWKYTTGDIVYSSPAVSNGVVYVGSVDQNIYALDAVTGTKIWSTAGDTVYSSPAVSGGVVYVGSNPVYALNASTGTKIWSYTTPTGGSFTEYYSTPAVSGGVVYVGSYDDNVYALDAATGVLKWNYTTGRSIYGTSPAVSDGVVYVTSDNVYALRSIPTGSISGMKFNDTNFNTIKDPGEPGLNDWAITLSNQSGIIATQLTSGNGNYNFTNLPPDNYTVAEVIQPGWLQVHPQCGPGPSLTGSCTYTINLTGENIADKDFGNFLMGKISGTKFNDINGNGIKDPGEPGLPNWTINLRLGNVTYSTVTDSNGDYNFSGVLVGIYNISEILQPGWIQTAPVSVTHTVTILASGVNATLQDFGNFKLGEIHGTKFEDLNANGIKDQGEAGLQGWKININGIDTITNTIVNKTTTTDINGDYNFTGLTNGTYTITEVAQNNWIQSAPATGKYTVIITSGAVITKQDFGNFHKGKITGGGWISIKGDPKATFGIVGQYQDSKTAQGNVEYQDHKANLNIKSIQISTVATTLDNNKGAITGLAHVNGTGSYPFVVYVEDNGEPGKGIDVFNISLPTYPYSNGGILNGGNIQIHN